MLPSVLFSCRFSFLTLGKQFSSMIETLFSFPSWCWIWSLIDHTPDLNLVCICSGLPVKGMSDSSAMLKATAMLVSLHLMLEIGLNVLENPFYLSCLSMRQCQESITKSQIQSRTSGWIEFAFSICPDSIYRWVDRAACWRRLQRIPQLCGSICCNWFSGDIFCLSLSLSFLDTQAYIIDRDHWSLMERVLVPSSGPHRYHNALVMPHVIM